MIDSAPILLHEKKKIPLLLCRISEALCVRKACCWVSYQHQKIFDLNLLGVQQKSGFGNVILFVPWITDLQGKGYLYLPQKTVITLDVLLSIKKCEILWKLRECSYNSCFGHFSTFYSVLKLLPFFGECVFTAAPASLFFFTPKSLVN